MQVTTLLAAAAVLFWGSWATAFKLAGPKWRFEHFYFDFAFGALAFSLIAGLTIGSAGDGLTFGDAFLLTGRTQWAMAVAAGAVFNLGNMLLLATVEIAGMAVAFPLAMAWAAALLSARRAFVNRDGDITFLLGAAVLLLVSVALVAIAASRQNALKMETDTGNRKNLKAASAAKPVVLALLAGLFLFLCLFPLSRTSLGGIGMGSYAVTVLFTAGMVLTTFVYNLYFINLPVHGEPAGFGGYFQGGIGVHVLGALGGIVFAAGLLFALIVHEAEGAAAVQSGVDAVLVPASAILAALWGLLVWKEFRRADGIGWVMVCLGLAFLAAGLVASVYPRPA
jgi:glucose uptake protein